MAHDTILCKAVRQYVRPFCHPQMHILTRRLLEIDTTNDGNNRRAFIYNQRRRELDTLGSGSRWWAAAYAFNSFLLPPGVKAPSIYFFR